MGALVSLRRFGEIEFKFGMGSWKTSSRLESISAVSIQPSQYRREVIAIPSTTQAVEWQPPALVGLDCPGRDPKELGKRFLGQQTLLGLAGDRTWGGIHDWRLHGRTLARRLLLKGRLPRPGFRQSAFRYRGDSSGSRVANGRKHCQATKFPTIDGLETGARTNGSGE